MNVLLESGEVKFEAIGANRDLDEVLDSIGTRNGFAANARVLIYQFDFNVRQQGSRRVCYSAQNASPRALRHQESRTGKTTEESKQNSRRFQ